MKRFAQVISGVALVGLLLPAILFLTGTLDQETVKELVLYATILWFVSAPYWMLDDEPNSEQTASE